ncbi:MAG: glycosyltransferase family 4 protein [Acidobacteria bacterium]|nr:glycosyltransferase family 4 protein [Acidobacteriota bacterium]
MTRKPQLRNLSVMLLAHYYPPEMGGAAARLHGLARWLVRFGHQVTVVAGMPNYPAGIVPAEYRGRARVCEMIDGVDVLRTWIYASSHQTSLRRLANYFSFVASAIVGGFTAGRHFDVILASSPPLFVGLAGWVLARSYRVPWVFDIRDLWPDVAVEAGEFTPDAALTRWGYRLAQFLYCRADHITPVTENKRQKLLTSGVPSEKLTVVANGVDIDRLTCSTNGSWRVEFGIQDRFIVVYAGLIGIAQGVEVAVEAANALRHRPEIHFLIVGDGVRRADIVRRAEKLRLTNITFLPSQPRETIPAILESADVALVPLKNSQLADAVPSKLLEAWGCKRPVILLAGGEAAHLVNSAQGGVVVPPEEPRCLADAISSLVANRKALQDYGQNGYEFVKAHFEREALARRMEQVLFKVTGRGRA